MSGMKIVLQRLVRRFWVPRSEYDQAVDALRLAYGHIVSHHESHVVQLPGCFCPVCHHEDGSEPEMDEIAAVIHAANNAICVKTHSKAKNFVMTPAT